MLNNLKSYLEGIHVTPISWLAGVSGVLMVRFFLESLSNPSSSGFFASDASTLVHYYLFFMTGLLILLLLLNFILPEWKNILPQLVALSSVAALISPIIDWIVSGGRGLKMAYLFDTPREMIVSFFTLGGLDIFKGATIGLKIELALGIIFFAVFIYAIKKSWQKAFLSSLAVYSAIFLLAVLPGIVSILGQAGSSLQNEPMEFLLNSINHSSTVANNLHSSLKYSTAVRFFEISFNFLMGKILFLLCTALLLLWSYLNHKEKLKAVLDNFRTERVFAYLVMVFFGIFMAFKFSPSISMNWNDWLSVTTLCLSFVFSCLFAICANDMADIDTDKISNNLRPLVSNILSKEDMKQMGVIFLLASLLSGFLAGHLPFFFVLTFTALYYVYSVPPTRFKFIPFFSSFLISLCMLAAIISGFFLVSPIKYVSAFPDKLILAIVVIFFLLANVRDMKDVEGDKAAGIKTVPVLFGDVWGPKIVAVFAAAAFILVPLFSGIYILFIPAIPTAVLSWHFINKKPYKEKPLDITYFAFIFISFLLLFF